MSADPRSCTLSVAERWLGVSRQTLTKYLRDQGAPYQKAPEGKGDGWVVSVPDLHAWLVDKHAREAERKAVEKVAPLPDGEGLEGQMSKEEAQRRKSVADALITEMKFDREARRVVPIDAVAPAVVAVLAPARKRLMEYPQKIGREAHNRLGVDPNVVADIARDLVDEDLEALQAEQVQMPDGPEDG